MMDAAKNALKKATTPNSQFEQGHEVPIQSQKQPGSQQSMDPQPTSDQLPTDDGGYQTYKAAGKLIGKKAIITGGDSGIGRAIAVVFAMEGAESMIVHLPEEEEDARETKKMIEKYKAEGSEYVTGGGGEGKEGGGVSLFSTDLRERGNCRQVIETALSRMGSINILVNNHGYQMVKNDISELSEDQWLKTFDTNIHPFFYLSKYALEHMKKGDTIINCASVNPYVGRPDLLDYTSTKGAIVAFTRALSNQQLSKGIRVNAVCPGPIWTPLIPSTMTAEAKDQFTSPMGRPGQPSEVATCFVFLASQDSSFMSGQCLHPNGGTIVNG